MSGVRNTVVIWNCGRGENCARNDARIFEKVKQIAPMWNRLVLFSCNDYSWHGNPEPAKCPPESKRIFITVSYLSNDDQERNQRVKAFFVARPNDPEDTEKDRLRRVRADPTRYKGVYTIMNKKDDFY